MPRRPARPAIWVSSLWVRLRKPRSVRLVSPWSTTLAPACGCRAPSSRWRTPRGRARARTAPRSAASRSAARRRGARRRRAERPEDRLVERRLARSSAVPRPRPRWPRRPRAAARGEERLALGEHVVHRALAAGAAEDEVDRGQPAARFAAPRSSRSGRPRGACTSGRGRPARALVADQRAPCRCARRRAVDLAREIGDEVRERHRPLGMEDRHDRAGGRGRSSRRSPSRSRTVADSATSCTSAAR